MCHHGIVLIAALTTLVPQPRQAVVLLQVYAMSLLCLSNDGFASPASQTMTRMHVGPPIQSLQDSDSALLFIGTLAGDLLSSILTLPNLLKHSASQKQKQQGWQRSFWQQQRPSIVQTTHAAVFGISIMTRMDIICAAVTTVQLSQQLSTEMTAAG